MKRFSSILIGITTLLLQGISLAAVLANSHEGQYGYGYGYGYQTESRTPLPGELLINEFLSRPSKGHHEWIEIYNTSTQPLGGECELRDAVGTLGTFSKLRIQPKGYFLFRLSRSKLNNTGDSISLLCNNALIDEIQYGPQALPKPGIDQSLARFPDGSNEWFVFGEPTPELPNLVDNQSPHARIRIQGSGKTSACDKLSFNVTGEDSQDPNEDQLNFSWIYRSEQGVLHTSDRENPLSFTFTRDMGTVFEVILTVSDPFGGTHSSTVRAQLGHCGITKPTAAPPAEDWDFSPDLLINELFPNPHGNDKGLEFIELFNPSLLPIRLDGWKLGGKTKKSLKGLTIGPQEYLLLHHITLRNAGDTFELLDPHGIAFSTVSYDLAEEGKSLSKNESGQYRWTVPTPGQPNDFPFATETIYLQANSPLIITRVLPNPAGKDEGNEWIEIRNRSDQSLDITGWQLDNREGGSNPFLLEGTLKADQTLRLVSSQTHITLRNTADQARILDPSGQVIDLIEWKSPAPDGHIFTRNQLVTDLSLEPDVVQVLKIIDGDTIDVELNGSVERVRLIGVDTPETVHPFKPLEQFGKEASAFTRQRLEGKTVRLEYDLSKRGKYGRLLAYVWLDDQHFNAELIAKGYAFAYLRYPFQYREAFRKLEQQARQSGLGMWQSEHIEKVRQQQQEILDEELEELKIIEEILQELEEELPQAEPEQPTEAPTALEQQQQSQQIDQRGWEQIKLIAVLPNPEGKDLDGGEYLELINLGQHSIALSGWSITNNKNKTIAQLEGLLASQQTLRVTPSKAIKNTTESLQLLDPLNTVRDQLSYNQAIKSDQYWYRELPNLQWLLSQSPERPSNKRSSTSKIKPLFRIISPDESVKEHPQSPFRVMGRRLIPAAFASEQSGPPPGEDPLQLLAVLILLAIISLGQVNAALAPGMTAKDSSSRHP